MKLEVTIPAYNEGKTIANVISEIPRDCLERFKDSKSLVEHRRSIRRE